MRDLSTTLLAAALLSAAAAAPVSAATKGHGPAGSAVTQDVRCLVAMAVFGQDKQRQQAAQVAGVFFAGRVSAHAPGIDLPSAVHAQEAVMTPKDLPGEVARCGALVQSGLRALQTSFSAPAGAGGAPPAAPAPAPPAAPFPAAPATQPH
jgi:hypothetical protein